MTEHMEASAQIIFYLATYFLVILHYIDSAKEHEWTDSVFRNSYGLWFAIAAFLMAIPMVGMPFLFAHTLTGNIIALITALGGLGAAGYHIPMHIMKRSKVCLNGFSYVIMILLSVTSVGLLITTIKTM